MSNADRLELFKDVLSLQLTSLVPAELCSQLIHRFDSSSEDLYPDIIQTCTPYAFAKEVDDLLRGYFEGDYQVFCSRYDRVGSDKKDYAYNCLWHLDGGVAKTLKLFVYLNPVSSQGGNTLIIDQARTKQLRNAGALPLESEKRFADLSEVLDELGLSRDYLAYDLKCGDALLFSPLLLAHKCHLPNEGKYRHTICYTIIPSIF